MFTFFNAPLTCSECRWRLEPKEQCWCFYTTTKDDDFCSVGEKYYENKGKTAKWIPLGHLIRPWAHPDSEYYQCSLCGYEQYNLYSYPTKQCPHCGATMEGVPDFYVC